MAGEGRAKSAVRFGVHVQPRASRSEAAGMHDGCWKIRLAEPPVDGAANDELVAFLAQKLGVAKSRVRIVSGAAARRKVVEIDGVGADAIAAALR